MDAINVLVMVWEILVGDCDEENGFGCLDGDRGNNHKQCVEKIIRSVQKQWQLTTNSGAVSIKYFR